MVDQLKEIATGQELSVSELVRRYLDEKIKDSNSETTEVVMRTDEPQFEYKPFVGEVPLNRGELTDE